MMHTYQSTIQRHFIFGIICAQVIHCNGANDDLNAKPGPQQFDQPRTRRHPDDADANIKELEDVANLNKNDSILHGRHSPPGAMNNGQKKNNHRRTQSAAEIAAAKANNVELLEKIQSTLRPLGVTIDSSLFLTQLYEPSKIYKFMDLDAALEVAAIDGIADNILYLGDVSDSLGHEYGLVNLAAFLAQCMKETIQYDACDENNWDLVNGVYPLSNACGQLEQSYQDYKCPPEEQHMECPVDPNMEITATTHANWYGAPPGLFCAPKSKFPITGIWDHEYWCDCPWNGESCDVYEGQKSGRFDNEVAVANRAGRTDVEGCCWWGRGVIQTTGVCNYGKLNYYLGKAAADEGRDSRYPDIDFCKTPEIICASEEYAELKWIAGLFYWMKDVQSYNQDGWYYLTELHKFVNGGMTDMGFIDAVSGIVNRGCHNPPCATGEVDGLLDRRGNFQKVLTTFGLPSVPVGSTRPPSTLPPVPGTSPASGAVILADSSPWLIYFIDTLQSKREELEYKALSYQQDGVLKLSDRYTFDALVASLTTAYQTGYGGNIFYLGKESDVTPVDHSMQKVGLTNIAAFLSQTITEHIQDDPCSDNNLVAIEGIYTVTSGCEKLEVIYPAVDFCSGPESVCSQLDTYRTLMWDIAFFEWIENVQSYDRDGWNYIEKLNQFVEGGLTDFSFISIVSKIVAKGSSDYVGEVPNANQRWDYWVATTSCLKTPAETVTILRNQHHSGSILILDLSNAPKPHIALSALETDPPKLHEKRIFFPDFPRIKLFIASKMSGNISERLSSVKWLDENEEQLAITNDIIKNAKAVLIQSENYCHWPWLALGESICRLLGSILSRCKNVSKITADEYVLTDEILPAIFRSTEGADNFPLKYLCLGSRNISSTGLKCILPDSKHDKVIFRFS